MEEMGENKGKQGKWKKTGENGRRQRKQEIWGKMVQIWKTGKYGK